jgi:hypothetical protein
MQKLCINNNNNSVIEAEETIPPTPPTSPIDPCEECFTQTLNAIQFAALDNGIVIPIGSLETEQ